VVRRLQEETLKALDAVSDKHWRTIESVWNEARGQMRGYILDVYHHFFADERWSLAGLRTSGAWHVLNDGLRSMTAEVRDTTHRQARQGINAVYRESIVRHAWVLDQTTPPNIKIRIPHKQKLFEAARSMVSFYKGEEAIQKFGDRWNAWSDGYYMALVNNLQMGALNGSSPSDAADEVDATRVNTPAYGLLDAYQRMFAFETVNAINLAVSEVSSVNGDADVEQVWATRRDLKVCDDCDENEGLPEEEADGEIPLHPNCNCYWRIVPASWAELLRTGDPDAYDLAVDMDAQGIVPNAMVIRDEAGKLAGYDTVEFGPWMKENFYAVAGR